jgi:8-oxo-dGTP diphosphatase
MSAKAKPVPVVCALIERHRRVLLARRPAHKHPALKWEFPGGKVDAGETAEAALIREIREELGCDIAIAAALPRFAHAYGPTTVQMMPFVCRLIPSSAEPSPIEHVEIRWVEPGELLRHDLAAADRPIAKAYLQNLA